MHRTLSEEKDQLLTVAKQIYREAKVIIVHSSLLLWVVFYVVINKMVNFYLIKKSAAL